MSEPRKIESRCAATWINRACPDFECKLTTGHTVHVDPRTGQRWGEGSVPRGMRRRGYKKYTNPKLGRQSALMARLGQRKAAK